MASRLRPTKGYHFTPGAYVEYEGDKLDVPERDALLTQLQVCTYLLLYDFQLATFYLLTYLLLLADSRAWTSRSLLVSRPQLRWYHYRAPPMPRRASTMPATYHPYAGEHRPAGRPVDRHHRPIGGRAAARRRMPAQCSPRRQGDVG